LPLCFPAQARHSGYSHYILLALAQPGDPTFSRGPRK
jgi:hypothetical protein